MAVSAYAVSSVPAGAQTPGETVLHTFNGADGENAVSGLVLGANGVIYGTTRDGGGTGCVDYWSKGAVVGCGTVFELVPPITSGNPWTFQTIYTFTGGADGAYPSTLLLGRHGVLYGSTGAGGTGAVNGSGNGVLFVLIPPASGSTWTERVLYNFCRRNNCVDGASPGDGLIESGGALYGTTAYGGTKGVGSVFKYTLPTSTTSPQFTSLYSFQGLNDGAIPFSGVVMDNKGRLYGVTYQGGGTGCSNNGCGVVYELSPRSNGTYQETVIYSFQGVPDGAQPGGRLKLMTGGHLIGVTGVGGSANYGTVFELTPPAALGQPWTETILTDFGIPNLNPPDSTYPNGNLAWAADGSLWGTTFGGGNPNNNLGFFFPGTIFQLQPPSQGGGQWSRNLRYSFMGGTDGVLPNWGLIAGPNNTFYGTTAAGGGLGCPPQGNVGCGTVFEWIPF